MKEHIWRNASLSGSSREDKTVFSVGNMASAEDRATLNEMTPAQERKAVQLLVRAFLPAPVRRIFEKKMQQYNSISAPQAT